MNPPNQQPGVKDYRISKIEGYRSLYVIDSYLINNRAIDFLRLRLKMTWFYDHCLYRLVKRICSNEKLAVHQVWNFDPNLHGFLYKYPAGRKVFFAADQVQNHSQTRGAKKVSIVVSVAEEILAQFRQINKNCLLINHGLNSSYETYAQKRLENLNHDNPGKVNEKISIGYIGNLLIPSLYEEGLLQIVTEHPETDFHFWGAYDHADNNLLANYDLKIYNTIQYIKNNCSNTFFHGIRSAEEIISELDSIDIFIYINSSLKDINGGANSHKILEYLSTGKPIVSTYLSFYKELDLLLMTDKGREEEFSSLFNDTLANIAHFNSIEIQRKKITYALSNTYRHNIERILENEK